MPTPTYTPLATVTLGSSASSVTLSNIPASYRDLVMIHNGTTSATADFTHRFNGDTGANYSRVFMFGNGSTTVSGTNAESYWFFSQTGSIAQNILHIMDYSATNKHKTVLARYSQGSNGVSAIAGRWANTAAITSIQVNAPFNAGTTLSLYGIAS